MFSRLAPRWIKLVRDVQLTPGRVAMMVLAIAAGVCGLATMLSAYTILDREISRNYLDTIPPAATLKLDRIDPPLIESIRRFPGIAEAQASSTVGATLRIANGTWLGLTIFVIDDFNALHINTVYREAGAWPPPNGTLLLEREALRLIDAKIGGRVALKTADGVRHQVEISGTLHDPALPPANRGQTVFAYATPATVAALGLDGNLRLLELTVSDKPFDIGAIEATVAKLALWLKGQGCQIEYIRIPPPGQHPHQKIMASMLLMLLAFSGIALILSAVLTATILGGILAQQTRQIGIMKALGARSAQIAGLYLTMVALTGALATLIGTAAGVAGGRFFASVVLGKILNFTMHSAAVPGWVYLLLILAGVLVPLALAIVPILHATRITVQAAISDFGGHRQDYTAGGADRQDGAAGLEKLLFLRHWVDRSLLMALRNSFRRRTRLMLTLSLLSIAGAMVIGSLNIRKASEQQLIEAAADRHYDVETFLSRPQAVEQVKRIVAAVPGVALVEAWSRSGTARARADGLEIERVYPDGAHGTLNLMAVPESSTMLALKMLDGHWLLPTEADAVVLNNAALELFPQVRIGDTIDLASKGRMARLRLVGVARQLMSPATAFVAPRAYGALVGQNGRSDVYRIVLRAHDERGIAALTGQIEAALAKEDIKIKISITETMLRKEVDGHFDLLIGAMLFIAVLMALVGAFGLGAAMSASVAERSREFGIMRAIGASSGVVLRNVVSEGVFIGLMSVPLAVLLALPLSAAIGDFLGNMLYDLAFPLVLSAKAVLVWLLGVTGGAMLASGLPAWRASRVSIRQALATL